MKRIYRLRTRWTAGLALMLSAATVANGRDVEKDYLPRLFIAPAGRLLPSGVVSGAFGGAFASQGGQEYLGLFSVGLGGVAEFEVSTSHLVTNIFRDAAPVGTTALKFALLSNKPGSKLPDVQMALRSNRWSNVNRDNSALAGPAGGGSGRNIYNVEFSTHLTSLYLASSYGLSETVDLHGGLVFHEYRTRDFHIYGDVNAGSLPQPGDFRGSLVSLFAGVERAINENTHSIIEFGSKPRIWFDDNLLTMKLDQIWYGMAGVRFFISDLTALDAGLRYRSDFTGLADTEIRAGLNVGLDVVGEVKRSADKKRKREGGE